MVRTWLEQLSMKSFASRARAVRAVRRPVRLGVEVLGKRLVPSAYTLTAGNLYQNTSSGEALIDTNVQAFAQSTASGSQQVYDLTSACQVKQYNGTTWNVVTGGAMDATGLVSAGGSLYMLGSNPKHPNTVWQYTGSGISWTAITGTNTTATALASAGGNVYMLAANNGAATDTVWQYTGSGTSWAAIIGSAMHPSELASAAGNLYMLGSNPNHPNTVWQYNGSGTSWAAITGTNTTATTLVSAGGNVYMLAANNGAPNETVWEYNGSGTSWTALTGPNTQAFQLVAAGNLVYIVGTNGGPANVWEYTGAGINWTALTGTALPNALSTWFLAATDPAADVPYTPVLGPLYSYSTGIPSYLDVSQGYLGDCWLLASLAETAARAPADIMNMFIFDGYAQENGATVQVYSVRYYTPSGLAQYLTVDSELPEGGLYYDNPVNGVQWVALAEKAYAEANAAGFVTSSNVGLPSYDALNDGYAPWALQAITGKTATDYLFQPSDTASTIGSAIANAWNAGDLIVLSTSNPSDSKVVGGHCYAVVGYTPTSSQPFEIFNPWGAVNYNPDGTYSPLTPSMVVPGNTYWVAGYLNSTYGLFWASATDLLHDFSEDSFGTGAAAGGTTGGPQVSPPVVPKANPAPSGTVATNSVVAVNLLDASLDVQLLAHKQTSALDAVFADFGNG